MSLVAQAFELWQHQASALCHQRNCMERVILRMRNAKLAAAFDLWHCHALLFARQRTVLEKVIYRMAHRIVAIAFDKWRSNVLEMQRILRAVVLRFSNAGKTWPSQVHGASGRVPRLTLRRCAIWLCVVCCAGCARVLLRPSIAGASMSVP
jgi:hypothetical protein